MQDPLGSQCRNPIYTANYVSSDKTMALLPLSLYRHALDAIKNNIEQQENINDREKIIKDVTRGLPESVAESVLRHIFRGMIDDVIDDGEPHKWPRLIDDTGMWHLWVVVQVWQGQLDRFYIIASTETDDEYTEYRIWWIGPDDPTERPSVEVDIDLPGCEKFTVKMDIEECWLMDVCARSLEQAEWAGWESDIDEDILISYLIDYLNENKISLK